MASVLECNYSSALQPSTWRTCGYLSLLAFASEPASTCCHCH